MTPECNQQEPRPSRCRRSSQQLPCGDASSATTLPPRASKSLDSLTLPVVNIFGEATARLPGQVTTAAADSVHCAGQTHHPAFNGSHRAAHYYDEVVVRRATCSDGEGVSGVGGLVHLPAIERSTLSFPTVTRSRPVPIPSRKMRTPVEASPAEEMHSRRRLLRISDADDDDDRLMMGADADEQPNSTYRLIAHNGRNTTSSLLSAPYHRPSCSPSQQQSEQSFFPNKSSPAVLTQDDNSNGGGGGGGSSLPAQLGKVRHTTTTLPYLSKTPPVMRSDCKAAAMQYRNDIATRKAPRRYDIENVRYALLHGDIRV